MNENTSKSVKTGLSQENQRETKDPVNDQQTFNPIASDESNQARQIAHLKFWISRVSEERSDDYCEFLCRGIAKFIELDLLRYDRAPGSFSGNRGFGVVCQSAAARSFIESEILPANLDVAALLTLIADGRVLVETAYADGDPGFSFCLA